MNVHIIVTPPPMPREWAEEQADLVMQIQWVDHEAARLRKLLREHGWKDWGIEAHIG